MQPRVSPSDHQLQIKLLQERSAGTFARVYLAEARGSGGLSRVVAVKVLKEQWSDSHEILTRTRDEARLLARLQHRNILRVEALAEVDGQPAIVMEFVDGLDLQQLIERLGKRDRRIPRRTVYSILAGTASALAAAWEEVPVTMSGPLRVVHRDIKPSNVMVSRQGEVKVLDFGTARFDFTERQARTGAMRFGSLKYMAPERRRGDRGEHPSDVYALGLVAIETLQGAMLPVLPVDTGEHDQAIAEYLDGLRDLGLPDRRWDDALHQTLLGMVAADPARRLHASQVVPLFRSFADNATGESLESFAAGTVSELAREAYGSVPQGALSGSRVFVALTTSSDLPPPSNAGPGTAQPGGPISHRTMVPEDDWEDPALPEDPSFAEADRPTQISLDQPRPPDRPRHDEVDPVDRPTQVTAAADEDDSLTDVAGPPPGLASSGGRSDPGQPLPVSAAPARGSFPDDGNGLEPNSVTRPSTPAVEPPPPEPALEPPPPPQDEPSSGRSNLVAGVIAALVVFILGGMLIAFALAAIGLYWYSGQAGPEPAVAEVEQPDLGGLEALADAPAAHSVELRVDDEMLQWTAIEDPAGERLFKGSPGGSIDLPAGEYRVLAKVRARSTVGAELSVDDDLLLSCSSAEKGEVHCDAGEGRLLVLAP